MTVTVVSCAYGTFKRFVPRWEECVAVLNPKPDAVIVSADRQLDILGARVLTSDCPWKHPQAWYLNQAIYAADTDWVWIVDIDDCPHRDGLAGIDNITADVWQMGFNRSDGETYIPPQLSNDDYLASSRNVYVAGSAIRTEAFRSAGGFKDVALQDWAMWRRLAARGAQFQTSGRAHYDYMRHPYTRGETELTLDVRDLHLAEMEAAVAA